jgi:hypothetical protein
MMCVFLSVVAAPNFFSQNTADFHYSSSCVIFVTGVHKQSCEKSSGTSVEVQGKRVLRLNAPVPNAYVGRYRLRVQTNGVGR